MQIDHLVRNNVLVNSTIRLPALINNVLRSAWVANNEPLPGCDNPNASVKQFIEFAVNIPEHDPHVGQAERSICSLSASLTLGLSPLDHRINQI